MTDELRKLDAEVAREVMEWEVRFIDAQPGDEPIFVYVGGVEYEPFYHGYYRVAQTEDGERFEYIPPFSTDLNAAELVLGKVLYDHWGVIAAFINALAASVQDEPEQSTGHRTLLMFLQQTNKPELICRAALAAVRNA